MHIGWRRVKVHWFEWCHQSLFASSQVASAVWSDPTQYHTSRKGDWLHIGVTTPRVTVDTDSVAVHLPWQRVEWVSEREIGLSFGVIYKLTSSAGQCMGCRWLPMSCDTGQYVREEWGWCVGTCLAMAAANLNWLCFSPPVPVCPEYDNIIQCE